MSDPCLPTVFVPGLFCSPRLFADALPAMWAFGAVTVADHRRDDAIEAMARRLLANAPERFGLVGLSMGGYVAFEVMRQAPQRVARLALLCTSARPDSPEQSEKRRTQIAAAQAGGLGDIVDAAFPTLVSPGRADDAALRGVVRAMAEETGVQGFAAQQEANIGRADSRPHLNAIACPTLVLTGERDQMLPSALSVEIAEGIPGAKLVTVADCGHLSSLEKPAEVTRALVSFWQSAGA